MRKLQNIFWRPLGYPGRKFIWYSAPNWALVCSSTRPTNDVAVNRENEGSKGKICRLRWRKTEKVAMVMIGYDWTPKDPRKSVFVWNWVISLGACWITIKFRGTTFSDKPISQTRYQPRDMPWAPSWTPTNPQASKKLWVPVMVADMNHMNSSSPSPEWMVADPSTCQRTA